MNNEGEKINFAINALNLGLQTLAMLGYELEGKIEFKKKETRED